MCLNGWHLGSNSFTLLDNVIGAGAGLAYEGDNDLPITKDQFLEITPLSMPFGWNRYYTYKILYKDENAKAGSAQIIFTNKQRSIAFGKALKRFGTD